MGFYGNLIYNSYGIQNNQIKPQHLDRTYWRVKREIGLVDEVKFRQFLGLSDGSNDLSGDQLSEALSEMRKTLYCFSFSTSFTLGIKLFGTGVLIGWFREKENVKELCCLALEDRAGQVFVYPLENNGEIVKNPIENEKNVLRYDNSWDTEETQAINFLEINGITTSQIINSAITSNKIKNGAITTDKVYDLAITTKKIANGNVTENKLGTESVTRNKIKNGEVIESKLALNSVTRDKIKDGEVIKGKLGSRAVLTDNVEDRQITPEKLSQRYLYVKQLWNTSMNWDTFCEEVSYIGNNQGTLYFIQAIGKDKMPDKYKNQGLTIGRSIAWATSDENHFIFDFMNNRTWQVRYNVSVPEDDDGTYITINEIGYQIKLIEIKNEQIANNSVNENKLAPNSVKTTHLGQYSVTNLAIAPGAVALNNLASDVKQILNQVNPQVNYKSLPIEKDSLNRSVCEIDFKNNNGYYNLSPNNPNCDLIFKSFPDGLEKITNWTFSLERDSSSSLEEYYSITNETTNTHLILQFSSEITAWVEGQNRTATSTSLRVPPGSTIKICQTTSTQQMYNFQLHFLEDPTRAFKSKSGATVVLCQVNGGAISI